MNKVEARSRQVDLFKAGYHTKLVTYAWNKVESRAEYCLVDCGKQECMNDMLRHNVEYIKATYLRSQRKNGFKLIQGDKT